MGLRKINFPIVFLNNLSAAAKRQLTAPRKEWFIFLSRLALEYHKGESEHPVAGCEILE
ncbi:MAG: hypothetical protein GQ565_10780 [Candidatus Aegiribacteria sp.]|nr:hypothetical protein [Candidatus Aegiribacteria sp.]